jgi:Ohr subfamily peroxiredoxin
MTKIQKVLLTGKTLTTISHSDTPRGGEPPVDLHLSSPNDPGSVHTFAAVQPHPTAEQLFAGAWSACYITAIAHVARGQKVKLPSHPAVTIEVDLGTAGDAYLLQARFNVTLAGLPLDVAETLAHAAHEICPYSKATRGNIDVSMNVLTS